MSGPTREASFTLAQVFTKDGETNGRKWTRYDLKPAENEDERYSTFSNDIGGKAQEWRGTKVKVLYEETDRGNNIKELQLVGPLTDAGDKPVTRAEEAPKTQRSIAAAVALQQAVATVTHTIKVDADTDEITKKVQPLARRYFALLMELREREGEAPF